MGFQRGWIPLGYPWCPPGTSLLSWLNFVVVPLSRWTQSSWNSCQLRQRSWPRSILSRGSGTSKHFWWVKSALCSGQPNLTLSWDSGLDTFLRFPPHALLRSGGEPASTALGRGRSSLGVAVSHKSIAHICGQHPELQKLWSTFVCHGGQQKGKAVSK